MWVWGVCNVSLANAGQSLFNLHLSGDWHHSAETLPHGSRPHMMRRGRELLLGRALVCRVWGNAIEAWRADRKHVGVNMSLPRCMLISNLTVDQVSVCVSSLLEFVGAYKFAPQRFANGTQGRMLQWHPGSTESKRRALPAYCPAS